MSIVVNEEITALVAVFQLSVVTASFFVIIQFLLLLFDIHSDYYSSFSKTTQ
jgi:hypothetical protein